MADSVDACAASICWVRVCEMAERRASFCGLGGIGGGATWAVGGGRALSMRDVRRSGGGFGFGGGTA